MSRGRRYDRQAKLNVKKIVGILVAIAVIIMFVISINKLLQPKEETPTQELASIEYFTVYQNGKWGVINQTGKIIIEPTQEEMILIPDSTKPVFIYAYEINEQDGTYKTKVLNDKNEEIFTQYELVEAIDNVDSKNNISYQHNVLRVRKDGKYGLINFDGTEVLKCEYDQITSLKNVTNSIIIKMGETIGLCNNLGEVVIEPKYTQIQPISETYEDGYIVINAENKYGVINANKRVVLEVVYEEIKPLTGNDMYYVKQEKWKVVNKSNEVILESGFDDVISIDKDYVTIKKADKFGVINTKGETLLEATYDDLKYTTLDNYIFKKDNLYGIVNINKEEKIKNEYANIEYIEDADVYELSTQQTESEIMDSQLQTKVTGIISDINKDGGYLRIRVGEDYKYYNFKLEEKPNTEILTGKTLFLSKKDGKYGYVDKNGEVIVEHIYEDATEQNKFCYSAVKKDGKWGSIDKTGKVVLEPSLDLENYFVIDFIDKWHLGKDLNMNYYEE